MKLREKIRIDVQQNRGNKKGQFIVVSYRIVNHIHNSKNILTKFFGFPLKKMYHWVFIWLLGIEIPEDTQIGIGLQVWHGTALVINHKAIIGDYVLLRHSITIGNKYQGSNLPIIGNHVEVGANSVLIGGISIGNHVTIGAGSIVTKSIPDNSIAFGNPAIYKQKV